MKRAMMILSVLAALWGVAAAQSAGERAKDEAAIRAIVANLSDSWTQGDARKWGEQFAENADFTVWTGMYLQGREAITRGHEEIFQTIYKETKLRIAVRSIRFLREDVAAVFSEASVVPRAEAFPAAPQVVPTCILTKEKGRWQIAVFQNTRVQSR